MDEPFGMYARMASPTSCCRGSFCAPPRLEWFTVNVSEHQSKSLNSRRDIFPAAQPVNRQEAQDSTCLLGGKHDRNEIRAYCPEFYRFRF